MLISTKFQVNKEKRTVVCIITTVNDILDRLAKHGFIDEKYEFDIRVYKGIAKCSPEDEWNEGYGKRLAEYRATRARQVDVNAELKKYINRVKKDINALETYSMLKNPHKPNDIN